MDAFWSVKRKFDLVSRLVGTLYTPQIDSVSRKNGVSSIFGTTTTLFDYFNKSKIELTPFLL